MNTLFINIIYQSITQNAHFTSPIFGAKKRKEQIMRDAKQKQSFNAVRNKVEIMQWGLKSVG
jgi:hypothetical protein